MTPLLSGCPLSPEILEPLCLGSTAAVEARASLGQVYPQKPTSRRPTHTSARGPRADISFPRDPEWPLGDKPARRADHFRAAVMIGRNDFAQVLAIELSRERGRTHKVAEHDRELTAFSRSCNLRRLRGRSIRCRPACGLNASCRQSVTAFQAEFGTRRVRVAARRTASDESRTAL
jgi:hypothetical protein